jgi:hypothetical protein
VRLRRGGKGVNLKRGGKGVNLKLGGKGVSLKRGESKRVILVTAMGVMVRMWIEVMVNIRLSVAVTVRVGARSHVEVPVACVLFMNGPWGRVIPRRSKMSLR